MRLGTVYPETPPLPPIRTFNEGPEKSRVGPRAGVVRRRCQTAGSERGSKAGQDTNPAMHPGGDIRRGR